MGVQLPGALSASPAVSGELWTSRFQEQGAAPPGCPGLRNAHQMDAQGPKTAWLGASSRPSFGQANAHFPEWTFQLQSGPSLGLPFALRSSPSSPEGRPPPNPCPGSQGDSGRAEGEACTSLQDGQVCARHVCPEAPQGADSQPRGPGSCPARLGEAEEGSKGRKLAPHTALEQGASRPLRAPGGHAWGHSMCPQVIRAVEIGQCPPANGGDGLTNGEWGVLAGSEECSHQQGPSGVQALPTGLLAQGEGHGSLP